MFDLKNAKWISSPSEPPVFENNEEHSYLKAFGKPDTIVIENYGESPIFRFMRLFPGNSYIKRHINSRAYLRRYRIMNHLSAAPNAYQMKNPLIYVVVRNGCKYRFEKINGVDEPDFLDLMVQVIESSDKYCDEMTAMIMDCCNLPKKCWFGQPERNRQKLTRVCIWQSIHSILVGEKMPKLLLIKATPHKDCASDAQSDFPSDCINSTQQYCRIARRICVIWRKICKQMTCKAVRRALCGVALSLSSDEYG